MTTSEVLDVVVVGGGAAGLSGALNLVRSDRSVVVVDDGTPRNAPSAAVHGLLGNEGIAPAELLRRGRAEVAGYGGRFVDATAATAERVQDGDAHLLAVTTSTGERLVARRLLVTTGLVDQLPDVPGVAERWGRDVVHCPYCHGYEVRGERIGVLATSPMWPHQTMLFRQLSEHVTLLVHDQPSPDDEQLERLAARGIAVVEGRVGEVCVSDDRLTGVRLGDGPEVRLDALVVGARAVTRSAVLEQLGVPLVEDPMWVGVEADPTGRTPVPGVFAAGNVVTPFLNVVGSMAAGAWAGVQVNNDLVEADTVAAVARRRAGAPA